MPGFITRNPRFKPTSITGCKVWLDATYFEGGSPSRWPDRSGNGNDAVPSDVINTIVPTFGSMNGLQTLHFTAANRTLLRAVLGSSFASGNETYFFVGQLTGSTPSATRILSDSTSQRQWLVGGSLPNTFCMYAGSTPATQNLTIAAFTPFLATSVNTAGTLLDYKNGTANTQSLSASTTTLASFYLGGTNTGADGEFMDGDIGEVIVYSTALAEQQRQQIEGYLAQKWGLVAALPLGHPAYSMTFYPSRPQIKPIVLSPSVHNTLLITSVNIISPPTSPTTIASGLVLWLDAADSSTITDGDGGITAWRDKSYSQKTVTLTEVAPSYSSTAFAGGKPCMTFSTASYLEVELGSEYMNQDFAMFVVWNQTTPGTATVVSVGDPGSETGLGIHATGPPPYLYNLYHYGGNESHSAKIYPINSAVVHTGVRSSGNFTCTINSKAGDTVVDNAGTNTSTTLYVGSDTFAITAQVCEVLLYSATLTTDQQQKIEAYLAWKWGLQGSLDSSNPYKSAAP